MTVLLGTLVLNEREWLERLYAQHKDWPGLTRWCFVEAADTEYHRANPEMVSADGLSVDGTTEWLEQLAKTDDRVVHVKHGFTGGDDPAQGKIAARNRYLELADEVRPDVVITLDADEAYTRADQQAVLDQFASRAYRGHGGLIFHRREIWRPPSISDQPLFSLEVVGGFWAIPCCHWWRWSRGLRYQGNHNNPRQADGSVTPMYRLDHSPGMSQMIHLGFAAGQRTRTSKNRYYAARGEAVDPKRAWYVQSRRAWETWQPGDALPHGASVRAYDGPQPEAYA